MGKGAILTLKLQRPLVISPQEVDGPLQILAYNKARNITFMHPMSEEQVLVLFKGKPKVYAECYIPEGGYGPGFQILDVLEPEPW